MRSRLIWTAVGSLAGGNYITNHDLTTADTDSSMQEADHSKTKSRCGRLVVSKQMTVAGIQWKGGKMAAR